MVPRTRQSDPLDAARAELQRLRDADDWNEATPVVHVNVQQAPAARRSTPPAPPPAPALAAAPRSLVPSREGIVFVVLRIVGHGVQRMPPVGLVLIFAMLIVAWVFLAVNGKAPVP